MDNLVMIRNELSEKFYFWSLSIRDKIRYKIRDKTEFFHCQIFIVTKLSHVREICLDTLLFEYKRQISQYLSLVSYWYLVSLLPFRHTYQRVCFILSVFLPLADKTHKRCSDGSKLTKWGPKRAPYFQNWEPLQLNNSHHLCVTNNSNALSI